MAEPSAAIAARYRQLAALQARLLRGWAWLDSDAAQRRRWLLPLLFGLLSLLRGQDDNWDLHNYHLYNPFALLHGKIGLDLAPGQWQSYFNPLLDLVYYSLNALLPAPLAGFIMGVLHGMNALLVLDLARRLLPPPLQPSGQGARRLPLLLALAGCMGVTFFSELGNSMGDNLTALSVLGALALLLRDWDALAVAGGRALALSLLAGLVMGAGTGLKLTNATYALAACIALLLLPGGVLHRLLRSFMFGVGVLAGIAATAGYWYWRMWSTFGNPLFPQFNDVFKAPLAASMGVGDTHWLPQGLAEKLLWPLIFSLHPERVSEIKLKLIIWPVLYVALVLLGLALLRSLLWRQPPRKVLSARVRFVLAFFVLAYLGWQTLFSIYRYLAPLELLAPLVVWLLAQRLLAPQAARRSAAIVIVAAVLLSLVSPGWGRARWALDSFQVQAPVLAHPEQSVVLLTQAPVGWYALGFSPRVAFASFGAGFPQSPAYEAALMAMLAQRSGPHYLLLMASSDALPGKRVSAQVRRLALQHDQEELARASTMLRQAGIRVDSDRCTTYHAYIGRNDAPYMLCPLTGP